MVYSPARPGKVDWQNIPTDPVPTIPPGLAEWLPSGFFTAFLGLIWYELKASAARVNKRIDDLRDNMKTMDIRHREDNRALDAKLDRLLEARDGLLRICQDTWKTTKKPPPLPVTKSFCQGSGNQVLVAKPLPTHSPDSPVHLVSSVTGTDVVSARKFRCVGVQAF